MKRSSFWLTLAAVMAPAAARACSVCLTGDDDAVTQAFNWSVGFLLTAPYAIGGTVAACLVIAYRRAAARRAAEEDQPGIGQAIWLEEEGTK